MIQLRMDMARGAAQRTKESKNIELKSSVGDKHETSRAILQLEQEKNEGQFLKAQQLLVILNHLDLIEQHTRVEFGSLVLTSSGNFYISVGLGKIINNNVKYYCISPHAPIALMLIGKTEGQKIIFQEKRFEVVEIV